MQTTFQTPASLRHVASQDAKITLPEYRAYKPGGSFVSHSYARAMASVGDSRGMGVGVEVDVAVGVEVGVGGVASTKPAWN